jgi:hypothetical protein
MSLFTRDKIWVSADKRSYIEYDAGVKDMAFFVEGDEVVTLTSGGMTVHGTLASSGALAVGGRLSAVGGMSWSVEGTPAAPVAGGSTFSLDAVVSIIAGTTGGLVYTLPAPSSAGILKIVANISTASTGHIDFSSGAMIQGYSTANNINLLPNGEVGLLSLSTVAWLMLFPTTVATAIVSTLAT